MITAWASSAQQSFSVSDAAAFGEGCQPLVDVLDVDEKLIHVGLQIPTTYPNQISDLFDLYD